MEHYGSTLGTTACAVFGLVAAAHILHPGNYEARERPAVAASVIAASTAWIDPPTRASTASAAAALDGPERALLRVAMASPAGVESAVPPLAGTATGTDRAATDAARPAKVIRRAARVRRVAVARTAQADRAAKPDTAAEPRGSSRIDPIGDLIRGLGLGGEG